MQSAALEVSVERPTVVIAQLTEGAKLFVWSLRRWVISVNQDRCAGCDLSGPYAELHCTDAIEAMHRLMSQVSRHAARPISIHALHTAAVSQDELALLRVVALAGERVCTRHAQRILNSLVNARIPFICAYAADYYQKVTAAGHEFSGWGELRLVRGITK